MQVYIVIFDEYMHMNTNPCKSEFVSDAHIKVLLKVIGFSTCMSLLRQGFRSYSFLVYWLIASNAL